jgi:NOL1/NOP2/fmu family ribosome biogenesis protein
LDIIKKELFNNIAKRNGININTQLKHQHKLSHDVNIAIVDENKNKYEIVVLP